MKFKNLKLGDMLRSITSTKFTKISPRSAEHWGVTECARCGTAASEMINARSERGQHAHFCPDEELALA